MPINIIKDKYLRVVFGLSFLILFFLLAMVSVKLYGVSNLLVVHFDIYKGIDFFGNKMDVFGILILTFAMFAINVFLANFLYNRERFLSYIFGFGSLIISILILIAISVIIFVN